MTNALCSGIEPRSMDQTVLDLMGGCRPAGKSPERSPLCRKPEDAGSLDLEDLDLGKLLEMNDSAVSLIHAVANLGLLLKDKLELIVNNLPYEGSASGLGRRGRPHRLRRQPSRETSRRKRRCFWRAEPVPPYGTGALRCPPAG